MQYQQSLKNAGGESEKQKIMMQRNMALQKQESAALEAGEIQKAMQIYQQRINILQQVNSAEGKANQALNQMRNSTLQMILAADKFKVTTTAMVAASSVQAVRLQSRRFDKIPAFNPVNSAQSKLNEEQKKLALSATSVSGALEVLRKKIAALTGVDGGKSSFSTDNNSGPSIKNGKFPEPPAQSGIQSPSSKEILKLTAKNNNSLEGVMKEIKKELSQHTVILGKIAQKSGVKIESYSI
jgi:hypothetical protein